jgi:hypothetical protein
MLALRPPGRRAQGGLHLPASLTQGSLGGEVWWDGACGDLGGIAVARTVLRCCRATQHALPTDLRPSPFISCVPSAPQTSLPVFFEAHLRLRQRQQRQGIRLVNLLAPEHQQVRRAVNHQVLKGLDGGRMHAINHPQPRHELRLGVVLRWLQRLLRRCRFGRLLAPAWCRLAVGRWAGLLLLWRLLLGPGGLGRGLGRGVRRPQRPHQDLAVGMARRKIAAAAAAAAAACSSSSGGGGGGVGGAQPQPQPRRSGDARRAAHGARDTRGAPLRGAAAAGCGRDVRGQLLGPHVPHGRAARSVDGQEQVRAAARGGGEGGDLTAAAQLGGRDCRVCGIWGPRC